jgi:hypothetical protein
MPEEEKRKINSVDIFIIRRILDFSMLLTQWMEQRQLLSNGFGIRSIEIFGGVDNSIMISVNSIRMMSVLNIRNRENFL